jgi:hypothetical protein
MPYNRSRQPTTEEAEKAWRTMAIGLPIVWVLLCLIMATMR